MLNALAAAALALSTCASSPAARVAQADPQERIDARQLEALVAGPAARLEAGDVDGAVTAFEALLAVQQARHGDRSMVVADHLMAFGLALFEPFYDQGLRQRAQPRSFAYFARAVAAYRAAFGPDDLEVALAISTYADAAMVVAPDDPPRDLDAMAEDAWRIRSAVLGPSSPGAVEALLRVGDIRGAPSRVRDDPAAMATAAAFFRRAIRLAEPIPFGGGRPTVFTGYFRLAQVHVRNGGLAEARAAVQEAAAHFRRSYRDAEGACDALGLDAWRYADFLSERGLDAEAAWVRETFTNEVRCFGIMLSPMVLPPRS